MTESTTFRTLCRDISLALNADDPDALGEARPARLQGETFQILQTAEGQAALLLTYLGMVPDDQGRRIYEQLLLLQLTGWANPDLRFGFDPVTGQVLLCTRLPAPDQLATAPLQALIQRLIRQASDWRVSLLSAAVPQQTTQET